MPNCDFYIPLENSIDIMRVVRSFIEDNAPRIQPIVF